MPEEQQRWYAIKIFERDDKVLKQLTSSDRRFSLILRTISKRPRKSWTTTAESIITNERYIYIASIHQGDAIRKKSAGKLSASDKIDQRSYKPLARSSDIRGNHVPRLLHLNGNRRLPQQPTGRMTACSATAGICFGIGSAKYEEAAENYGDSDQIIDGIS